MFDSLHDHEGPSSYQCQWFALGCKPNNSDEDKLFRSSGSFQPSWIVQCLAQKASVPNKRVRHLINKKRTRQALWSCWPYALCFRIIRIADKHVPCETNIDRHTLGSSHDLWQTVSNRRGACSNHCRPEAADSGRVWQLTRERSEPIISKKSHTKSPQHGQRLEREAMHAQMLNLSEHVRESIIIADWKSLSAAKHNPKTSQKFLNNSGPLTHKMKGSSENSHQKVHPHFNRNLGRQILGNTFSGPKKRVTLRGPDNEGKDTPREPQGKAEGSCKARLFFLALSSNPKND